MTIKLRFALLLGLLLGGLLLTLIVLRVMEQRELTAMLGSERESRVQLLSHWLDTTSRGLPQFTTDTAQGDELSVFLVGEPPAELRSKLEKGLAAAGVHWLWILSANGEPLFQAAAQGTAPAPPPLPPSEFVELVNETPSPHFFAEQPEELIEVSVRRIQPGRPGPVRWLAAARRWDEGQLHTLASLTEAQATLVAPHENVRQPVGPSEIELLRPLHDAHGHSVRTLRLVAQRAEVDSAIRSDRRQLQILGAFGLLVLIAMARALHLWVVRPLDRISASLSAQQPAVLGDLAKDKSELGRVAQLVVASFDHREALQREIAERRRAQDALEQSEAALRRIIEDRARLGRDLHDGVIQSLYAAGMGLAGVRAVLTPEQAEAASRLEQTRTALNETIHDVRNFIIGLEPEALKQQPFAQAVAGMLGSMRSLREFRSTFDINEEVARRLTLAQRVHALQITREAVSNALRHGQANRIEIALRSRGEFAEFEISDDGRGFDASTAVSSGKGLANFAVRARELGGELDVQSEPGRGTRVKLVFSLLIL